ncbi:MAG TPA: endonuclease [Longimicrobium sp.]|nr:endonuclease [Longimicrobium sp.]
MRIEITIDGTDAQPAVTVAAPAAEMAAREDAARAAAFEVPAAPAARAFGLLRANREREYYEEKADQAAREAYYAGIDPAGDPQARYRALSQLLSRTHTTVLSYTDARLHHLYVWVDLQENRMLRSLYTGDEYPPEKAIQDDVRLEAERVAQLRGWMASSAGRADALTLAHVEARLAELDEQGPYNCEHVVPQKWFKPRSLPMKSDLHHLFTCEQKCNSYRGSTPYGQADPGASACGVNTGTDFTPAQGKGPAARATLYFLLRYPGEINNRTDEYTESDLATLLRWHHDDPVTRFELHRNAAVHAAQGNRNPLIDFPEWADQIDFRPGLG